MKKEELVTIEPPVFVREKKWELFLVIGAFLGVILGYAIAFGKEIMSKVLSSIKTK